MVNHQTHIPHADPSIAYHVEWGFRREALLWLGDLPIGVNFHPIASEFHQWLLRKGSFSVFAEEHKNSIFSLTNPYAYHASVIAAILARAINATHEFAMGTEPLDDMEADIERIRLYNEQILYTARFCEASIKQLLYCTQIGNKKYYMNASLGTLLSTECQGCRNSGKERHKISLLGSLAHRYHLCLPFERCLFEHLKIVGRRRNLEAAHSEMQLLRIRTAANSREQLAADSMEAGNELVHMLEHIGDLETRMMRELTAIISRNGATKPPRKPMEPMR
jgi:hypothetical protein